MNGFLQPMPNGRPGALPEPWLGAAIQLLQDHTAGAALLFGWPTPPAWSVPPPPEPAGLLPLPVPFLAPPGPESLDLLIALLTAPPSRAIEPPPGPVPGPFPGPLSGPFPGPAAAGPINQAPALAAAEDQASSDRPGAIPQPLATDPEGDLLTWRIVGGADAARFLLNPATGALSFLVAPDAAQPADADGDNLYEVELEVKDAWGAAAIQALRIRVAEGREDDPVPLPFRADELPEPILGAPFQDGFSARDLVMI